jgi:hypothetical protein
LIDKTESVPAPAVSAIREALAATPVAEGAAAEQDKPDDGGIPIDQLENGEAHIEKVENGDAPVNQVEDAADKV